MNDTHYREKLSAFVDQELSKGERQAVAEHLLVCEACRREHDELKLGAVLAAKLPTVDAPPAVWINIQDKLDGRETPRMGLIPQASWFSARKGFAFATALIAVGALSFVVYLSLFSANGPAVVQAPQVAGPNAPPSVEHPPANSETPLPANVSNIQPDVNSNANSNTQPPIPEVGPQSPVPSWEVETLAGMPTIGDGSTSAQIAVGQLLETDGKSKAKITVADIGSVEVAPNSRVKLVGTGKNEHRLSLERGQLHAKIFAPPRLFIVDTPSGKAVDLGCEYTLHVDRVGNSILRVTGGFVALEDRGRESIVPAGMMCLTRKGKGLGTPFSAETDAEFRRALEQFDFSNGGSPALQTVLAKSDFYDMVTLWHLLSRASKNDRGAVFDQLTQYVKPPSGVTRDGILSLNKKMLSAWRAEVENVWFN